MWKSVFFVFPLIALVNGCFCQQPQCCQYLMAPSTVYVQMNPSAYGIVAPTASSSSTAHPSTTTSEQIFANHLQWSILTGKPWDQGNNIYYAVSAQGTPHPGAPSIDLNQPTLYFMPNWWNTIQQAAGIPKTSPFAIQFNSPAAIPSPNPPHQLTYHSYPPQNEDHVEPQPAATITVLNEQPDLLPQSAKDAQNLLQEIQRQLEKINHQEADQKSKESNSSINNPTSPQKPEKDETPNKSNEIPSTTKQPTIETTTQPIARVVSADNITTDSNLEEPRSPKRKTYDDEAPARSPQKFSHEADEIESRRRPTSTVIREHKLETGNNNLAINSSPSTLAPLIKYIIVFLTFLTVQIL